MTPEGYDHIAHGLFVGSAPPPRTDLRADRIDTLVLAAKEYQPPSSAFPGVEVLRVDLNDDGSPVKRQEVIDALSMAAKVHRRLMRGHRVLVTCAQGRNRSGLIAALELRMSGYSPTQAIKAIRKARGPEALSNLDFLYIVHEFRS